MNSICPNCNTPLMDHMNARFDPRFSNVENCHTCGLTQPKPMASDCSALPVYGIMDPDYARFFSMARCIAKAEGYALALHGSFTRDLDVIAIPWVASPNSTPSQLAHQIAGRTGLGLHPEMQPREHGRMTWTMHFPDFGDPRYVDFSVTPAQNASGDARRDSPIT